MASYGGEDNRTEPDSYTSQAHLAGLPLDAHPRIAAWVARMQALPGYPVLADQLPTAQQVAA